ncbi:uncharacterized protein E0L32_007395 [Thyridium curvatum]|uniref:Uncharacterized protein n=1 Tax=Thyridium curvatum TaxID=1093900 RepID=A0A507AWP4_9PEZI|nr:uncharacterized protein E0L32_007395 [Thyridium curvatum]TPX11897.1 hypothetical protein E0L32_007395 [Thyridium curvatum]
MRRPSLDLADPARNLEESIGSPTVNSPDPGIDLSMPPPEEDIDAVGQHGAGDGDDVQHIFAPPPHIAARLHRYRPTQARRKDSAASSRRNSISSAHSRSSHGCSRQAGPQSKYVAQHLRRASIIEDRKARLADRAAHAEKVRLRAALAKAAVRDTTASEERALAAAQARETKLAEIAAACAEEVKRAKAVAESMKERREQEILKMRQQMEERLAEAERRREEIRSRRPRARGSSVETGKKPMEVVPEVPEAKEREASPVSEDVAAERIQWWWRAQRRKEAVTEFQRLGLTIDGVRSTPFEAVVDLLAQERVLLVTSKMLRICGLQEGDKGSVNEMAAVRTFLSAFMILGHPAQVLSNKDSHGKGEQEQVGKVPAKPLAKDDLANPQLQELVGKARDLLICFENILSRLSPHNSYTVPPVLSGSLAESYAAFYNAFIAWKARDSNALVDVMLLQFVELDAIWQTVKDSTDPAVGESYRDSIKDNQAMLMARIKRLAGPEVGRKKIIEAVNKARKARAQKKPKGDTKPREANHTVETALGELGAVAEARPSPARTPSPAPESEEEPIVQIEIHVGAPHLMPDNRVIVHELSINSNYRLAEESYVEKQAEFLKPLFNRMRATMHEDQSQEHFILHLQMVRAIRDKLQRFVGEGGRMHAFIGEMFDTDVAKRQFLTGSFSYERFFSTVSQLLPKLCAPVRDPEVKDLVENKLAQGDLVERLEALMRFIDVMSSDHANYSIAVAAPRLIAEAPRYEAGQFAKALQDGEHDLEAAEAVWKATRTKVLAEASRRDPDSVNHPKSRITPERIYNHMLVDIFTQLRAPSLEEMPEMLRLDHARAVKLGALTRRIVTTAAILLQCKNLLKRDVRAPWRLEANRIMAVLENVEGENRDGAPSQQLVEPIVEGAMAALETGRSMPAATRRHLSALVGKIALASSEMMALSGGEDPREPVLRLLLNRVRGHVLARLAAASASEKVRATSTAGERLAGLGLAEFVERIRDMVDEVARVGAVDRAAHGVWWEKVAESVERDEEEDDEAEGGKDEA